MSSDIERSRKLADCGLKQRDGMVPECGEKHLIEDNSVLPKRALSAVLGVKSKAGSHNSAALEPVRAGVIPKEFKAAGGNSGGLFAQRAGRLAADGKAHTFHPIPHGPAQRHLATAGADGLCLEVKQDHPGTGTAW